MAEAILCSVEGCINPERYKGICGMHYQRRRKYGSPHVLKRVARMDSDICIYEGCERKAHAKGYCGSHYGRLIHHGDPGAGGPAKGRNAGAVCKAGGCESLARTKGLCGKHYQRLLKYGDHNECRNKIGVYGKVCTVAGCEDRHHANGYCAKHNAKYKEYGSATEGREVSRKGELKSWIESNVAIESSDCVASPFGKRSSGYSMVKVDGVLIGAHRYMCELAHGRPDSESLVARHTCGKGHEGCLNPSHLEWGTHKENCVDKWDHGTMPHGEGHYHASLSEDDVRRIRELRGCMKQKDIAHMFGIVQPTVSSIQLRKSWSWLE